MPEAISKRTPTETLMNCLESFGSCEATNCIVIWTDEAGNICWNSSTTSTTIKVGMLEFTKYILLKES